MSFGTTKENSNWPSDTVFEPLKTTLERSVNTNASSEPSFGSVLFSLHTTSCSASLTVAVRVPLKPEAVALPSRMRPLTTTSEPAPRRTVPPSPTATPPMLSTTAPRVGIASFIAGSPSSVNCNLFTVTSPPDWASTRYTLALRAASPTETKPSESSSSSRMKAMFMFSL